MHNEKEQDIQRAIIEYLRLKRFVVFKHHSTGSTVRENKAVFFRYGDKGISDLIACSPTGRFVAVEVKKKGGRATPEQLEFLRKVRKAGGIGILAFSIDDVMAQI